MKKLVRNPEKVSLRCTDVKRLQGSFLLMQISRKANTLFVSFFMVNFILGCLELRNSNNNSNNNKASCSVLERQKASSTDHQ